MLIVRLGLSKVDMYSYSVSLLVESLDEWAEVFNVEQLQEWDRARTIAFFAAIGNHLKHPGKLKKPADLFQIDGLDNAKDERSLVVRPSPDQMDAVFKRLKARSNGHE